MKLLQQLWDLADRNPSIASGKIGLYLDRPLSNGKYFCSPINTSTFAHTGGDGVHFGLLHLNGEVVDESPIIMTSPIYCGDEGDNIIVGSNLHEFLCLGCKYDYASLESLPSWLRGNVFNLLRSDWQASEELIEYYSTDQEYQECLALLITEFNLKPWTNVGVRLNELQQQYLPLLQLKEDT